MGRSESQRSRPSLGRCLRRFCKIKQVRFAIKCHTGRVGEMRTAFEHASPCHHHTLVLSCQFEHLMCAKQGVGALPENKGLPTLSHQAEQLRRKIRGANGQRAGIDERALIGNGKTGE